jgi:hypothetical protein
MVVLANYRRLDLRVARWLPTGDTADCLSAAGRQEMKLGSFFCWHFYWARGLWGALRMVVLAKYWGLDQLVAWRIPTGDVTDWLSAA